MRKNIAKISLFLTILIISSQIFIPIGPVPFTLQVFAVILTGLVLGSKIALYTLLLYILMGIVGIPVFSKFSGGIQHLIGPTGGYLIAFPLSAFISGFGKNKRFGLSFIYSILGVGIIYFLGWSWLNFYTKDLFKSFQIGVIPFILPDIAKAFLAVIIANKILNLKSSEEMIKNEDKQEIF